MDPDPANTAPDLGGGGVQGRAGGRTARLPAPAGGGVEVLACIVPGREPCFFLPGTPRWRPGARGPKQTKDPQPEKRGRGRQFGGASASPGSPVAQAAAPKTPQKVTGGRKGPQGDGSRLRASHSPVGWNEKGTLPNYGLGRRRAGRIDLLSRRSQAAEQREAGPSPSTSEASAAPVRGAPTPYSPLARLRAFSGLWK